MIADLIVMPEQTRFVLMIAFHFPPQKGSSGIQRTLRFAQHLPDCGWQPIVLTVNPTAYEAVTADLINDSAGIRNVRRAPAWDASRHFAVLRRYPSFLARPDRWISWWPGGILAGLNAIRQFRPAAIWSTYPIPTAHLIASALCRLSGLPWIADFRDPMAQPNYPPDTRLRRSLASIERRTVRAAQKVTLTTPSAVRTYKARYPDCAERFVLIENGYDEETFPAVDRRIPLSPGKITLLHSGIVYPSERDPTHLFEALGYLKRQNSTALSKITLRFRASVHEQLLADLAQKHAIEEIIQILPAIDYHDALTEMLHADGLIALQAANCNEQIPAKVYEYLRARRPILGFTDVKGDTARTLEAAGIDSIAPLDDSNAIARLIERFAEDSASFPLPNDRAVATASRSHRAKELAQLLHEVST